MAERLDTLDMFGAAAALTTAGVAVPSRAEAQADTGWITEVPGKARCFFDCPQHANGVGLLHILNYLGAYPAGQAGVASSFYGVGPASSLALLSKSANWSLVESVTGKESPLPPPVPARLALTRRVD